LQDAGRQEDARPGAGCDQPEPDGRAGLGEPVLRHRDPALPRRDGEEGPQAVTIAVPADVDLFVIGAGSGGVRAARVAAAHGAKVMIAEEFRIGGTCVIRGCVPKKLMVYASRYKDHFEDAAGFGWNLAAPSFDWRRLVAAKEEEISRLSAIYRGNLDQAGVAVEDGRATIEDAHRVRLLASGRNVSARIILISTGAAPVLEPDVPGREHAITSNEVFDLPELPKRLLIIGGSYIAVEFASIFARLGTEVSLAARGENILRGFDD